MRDYTVAPMTVLMGVVERAAERFYERERNRVDGEMYKQMCLRRYGKTPREMRRLSGTNVPYEKRVAVQLANRRGGKTHG
ncbi:hypothetical protein [Burkholderia metallica]|uniref:hypothetical protein n=1 Tax=Burkholderia metallica TaxID=488729 RepID=UPI000D1BD558|nr:hypothetical protein [Burkholderia metallica]